MYFLRDYVYECSGCEIPKTTVLLSMFEVDVHYPAVFEAHITTKLFCLNIWLISVQFFYLNYSVIFNQKGQVVIRSTIYSNLKVKYLVVQKPIYVGNLVSVLNICHFFINIGVAEPTTRLMCNN